MYLIYPLFNAQLSCLKALYVWGASTSHPVLPGAESKFGTLAVGAPFATVGGAQVMVLWRASRWAMLAPGA